MKKIVDFAYFAIYRIFRAGNNFSSLTGHVSLQIFILDREQSVLQSKEEWHFPFWIIFFRFRDIHVFVSCK